MSANVRWSVRLNGEEIDAVYYVPGMEPDDVKRGLVEHDGYDPGIEVVCEGEHAHSYRFDRGCGASVCAECGDHKGLARCYCGWARDGGDGRRELEDLGETIDPEE